MPKRTIPWIPLVSVRRQREQHTVCGVGVGLEPSRNELELELVVEELEVEVEVLEVTLRECCNGWAAGRACAAAVWS